LNGISQPNKPDQPNGPDTPGMSHVKGPIPICRDMGYIARHYHMDLSLALALGLEGKTNQEKFKELDWGLRVQSAPAPWNS